MYKKWSIFIVVAILIMGLLLTACGTQTETTKSTTAPTQTVTQSTQPVQSMTIKFGYPMPKIGIALDYENYFNSISAKTNGRLKFEYYPASSLYQVADAMDATKKGITDIGIEAPEQNSKQFAATMAYFTPSFIYPSTIEGQTAASHSMMAMIENLPAVQNEWKDVKVLFNSASPSAVIMSTKKDIKVPSDLKGLKIGGYGSSLMGLAQFVGGAAVVTAPPTAYQNMKTGVIDAYVTSYSAGYDTKLVELTKYVNEWGPGESSLVAIMNWDTWNKISSADQKLITDNLDEAIKALMGTQVGREGDFKQEFSKVGGTINIPGTEWNGVSQALTNSWIESAKASGVTNTDEILTYCKKIHDDYVNKNIMP
jgi:TRAP-type C4-dicarboxylate transport system substrate-binding protein